jgi:hypothetical protein
MEEEIDIKKFKVNENQNGYEIEIKMPIEFKNLWLTRSIEI